MGQQTFLITGATGFIGFHLTRYLIDKGEKVKVIVRKNSPGLSKMKNLNVDIHLGDITDLESIKSAFQNVDKVFHCAGYVSDWGPKKIYNDINVIGTRNVLEASKQASIKRFIALSTNDVFGRIENEIIDESCPLKKWNEPYPDSKIEAEKLIWEYYTKFNLPVTISYPCWVYGPEDTTFLPHLIEAIEDGSFLYWRKNSHFFPTYIDNLIDQLYLLSHHDKAIGQGFLVHDGDYITLKDFCNKISEALKLKPVRLSLPYGLIYAAAKVMETIWSLFKIKNRPLLTTYVVKNLGGRYVYSIDKMKVLLGWTPKFPFEEGFARAMDWYKTEEVLNNE